MGTLILVFSMVTQTFNLPPGLLSAVCFVESRHKTHAINLDDGGSPSLGVCQIKLKTAQMLGFKGSALELQNAAPNVFYAGKYLRYQLNRYNGDVEKAIAAYNAGRHKEDTNGMTLNNKYVSRVLSSWSEGK